MDQQHFRTPIGDMRVIEVFLYYDGPKLFSCKDRTGQKYIAMLVDESEDGDRWFLVPVSDTRLERVRTGELGLRECVRYPENDWLWDVFIPYDGSKGDARLKYASTLQEHELPVPGAALSLPPRLHGETQHRNDMEKTVDEQERICGKCGEKKAEWFDCNNFGYCGSCWLQLPWRKDWLDIFGPEIN